MIRSHHHGFTLIEVVVALAIASVLYVLLFDGLRMGQRVSVAVEQRGARADAVAAAEHFLRRGVAQARSVVESATSTRHEIAFTGEGERIVFVAPMPERVETAGLYRFAVGLDRDEGRVWLRYRRFLDAGWDGGGEVGEEVETVLIDGVDALEIAYLERHPGGGVWRDAWRDRRELPQLVRLRIRLQEGTAVRELLVAPVLEGAA